MNLPIPTPAIVIDLAVVKRNIQRMAEYAKKHNLQLRPHTKTHKSHFFAMMQLVEGACGLTVAKVEEAQSMFKVWEDLLIGYPVVDSYRTQTAAWLAKQGNIRVTMDSLEFNGVYGLPLLNQMAQSIHSTIGVLVDVDVGYHRTGVQTPEDALELAKQIDASSNLRLDGIFCYYGHLSTYQPKKQKPHLKKVSEKLRDIISLWKEHGLEAKIVSGGSTPTAFQSHFIPELTEIRPGTYIFYDRNSISSGCCTIEDCAARIYTTVVSTSLPGKAVVDAGSKTLTSDRLIHNPDEAGYGLVVDYPEAKITRLTEEHGEIDIRKCSSIPKIGDRLYIIPNHICPCINLQNKVWVLRLSGKYDQIKIHARGMVI